jgi:hypothetical protein
MKYITILQTVLQLFPLLISAIKALEDAFPQAGLGGMKLGMIRSTLETAFSKATDISVKFAEIWPVLESVIAGIVTAANAAGVFKKKDAGGGQS